MGECVQIKGNWWNVACILKLQNKVVSKWWWLKSMQISHNIHENYSIESSATHFSLSSYLSEIFRVGVCENVAQQHRIELLHEQRMNIPMNACHAYLHNSHDSPRWDHYYLKQLHAFLAILTILYYKHAVCSMKFQQKTTTITHENRQANVDEAERNTSCCAVFYVQCYSSNRFGLTLIVHTRYKYIHEYGYKRDNTCSNCFPCMHSEWYAQCSFWSAHTELYFEYMIFYFLLYFIIFYESVLRFLATELSVQTLFWML